MESVCSEKRHDCLSEIALILKVVFFMLRYYLLKENKIKRIGLDSSKRSFPDLKGERLILLSLYYSKEDMYVSAARLNYILFDEEGKWDFLPIEKEAAAVIIDKTLDYDNDNKITYIRPLPELTENQEELLKKRIVKDFGKNTWYQVKLKIWEDRKTRKTF